MFHLKKYSIIAIGMLLILSLFLSACSSEGSSGGNSSSEEILVGVLLPVTGNNATDGKDMLNAMEMAAEKINNDGGVNGKKLKLEVADDACDPQMATTAANKLVSMKVTAVVGGYCSGSTLPASGVFNNAKIPMIVAAANSSELPAQGYEGLFLINGLVPDQAKTGADYFKDKGANNIVIIHDNSAYAKNLADFAQKSVEENGGKVIGFEAINPEEKDFGSLMTKLKSLNPDGTFFTGYYAAGGLMLKQFKEKDVPGFFMVGDGSYSPDIIDIAGANNADGLLVTATPTANFIPGADEFVKEYKSKYNDLSPGPFSALSYNGMNLLADALKRANSTNSEDVRNALKETKGFEGIGQVIEFNDQNSLNQSNYHVMKVVDGDFTLEK
ncbi:branched-chain amino acid ABC transporter substrate-binding protein [Bacillus sp. DTU_2020_1000418_1_SI_GHA_SEK_038]|uniref:branched-chain amino acid ABC transporter substrate-binding protein n=1 Tax=Bacillus sp. DTU_2020_1000418_1_SI_GHA_SEK_038 TaxID=3077585 RepID=UPI0028EC9336|nr:branched-chain amino acid ABC transporter substrate-binding protein [Bacillus sp. DTU_2020_1000418_1_SI_GHA_SEK_038]WNS74725.1 branched-chain amino acid ABC transporter substrate-binding protein [Bacillus sp. DTU_2020_1000418_1_SI_GHA_SEK_038]